jgi:hypothetical protein
VTDKVMGTCPCCFRKIAVRRWLMVDHGYKRCTGYHAFSCVAVRTFKPLEVSCGGLRWLVRVNKRSQRHDKQRLARKASWSIIAAIRLRIFGEANPIK